MKSTLFAFAAVLWVGCQTYDFEPVQPLAIGQTTQSKKIVAHQLKPNLMLLLDKSGSMMTNTSTASPCPAGGCGPGNPCPSGCPTRMTDMKQAMQNFLTDTNPMTNYSVVARVGAAFFPKDTQCTPTSQSEVLVPLLGPSLSDDDNQLRMQSAAVNTAIQMPSLAPGGGTPTAGSLHFIATDPSMAELQDPDRQNFVLLLTDGVPNCNPNNVNTCMTSSCNCTTSTCAASLCTLGCLDANGAVDSINFLRSVGANSGNGGIKTIVVGFGSCAQIGNTSPDCANAPQTLNAMAIAGGFARACPMGMDSECQNGGVADTCNQSTKLCNQSFYAAANAAELGDALAQISAAVGLGSICTYQLDSIPSDPKYLSVTVQGQALQSCGISAMGAAVPGCNTWTYDQSTGVAKVTFQGTTCDKVKAATKQNPVDVQFRIVTKL